MPRTRTATAVEDAGSASKTKKRGKEAQSSEGKAKAKAKGEEDRAFMSESRKRTRRTPQRVEEEQVELEEEVDDVDETGAKLTYGSRARAGGSDKKDSPARKRRAPVETSKDDDEDGTGARFIGDPVPEKEARLRWPHRYDKNFKKPEGFDNDVEIKLAKRHYKQAKVDGRVIYDLDDCAYVQAEDENESYICKIIELFEAVDGIKYFAAQWFYRACDTEIKNTYSLDKKRLFMSHVKDDNHLDCLLGKVIIAKLDLKGKAASLPDCDYYCDMLYEVPYTTFVRLPIDDGAMSTDDSLSTISSDIEENGVKSDGEISQHSEGKKPTATLLDMYAGCGAMSTGLCLGAELSGLKLVTRWAVDINPYACESLKLNHPETEVRNEFAEDFLSVLKEWEKLCIRFSLIDNSDLEKKQSYTFDDESEDDGSDDDIVDNREVFEVEKILQICCGDPNRTKMKGLYFKVRWKTYDEEHDSWEPIEGLGNCREAMREFVTNGFHDRILPVPGDVDVICGGPPCQGISGFNRFRNATNPLEDEKNKQLTVFMDVVKHLKPKYVLMENVVDLLKFSKGFLGRYALGRLVDMDYQTRIGLLVAGAYGLAQFRMRVFMWGACPTKKLPQYPLPTHDVTLRGVVPQEFEHNVVAYDKANDANLKNKLVLKDAISDLPAVDNYESRDEMPYDSKPQTEFQRQIRSRKHRLYSSVSSTSMSSKPLLYDHRPLQLNKDDYQRVCQIPKKKGANFRDLTGVRVGENNKVEFDPDIPRVLLESGKPLVPDYAMTFIDGKSSKPFGRLWWDEIVPTVVTRAEPHNQVILHPEQDRVLSVRENARFQGFPDCYKLCGPIKERYIQVGNAVAVPVAMALGYALGAAFQGNAGHAPLFKLPQGYPDL